MGITVIQEEAFRTKYRTTGTDVQMDTDYRFSVAEKEDKTFKEEVLSCLKKLILNIRFMKSRDN